MKAHRLQLYASRDAAAAAAGVSKDTWQRVEEGRNVRESSYAKVGRALGWAIDSYITVAEGGEPALVDQPHNGAAATVPVVQLSAEAVRRAAFEAARTKLPTASIGDVDDFSDEFVEVLRKAGLVADPE